MNQAFEIKSTPVLTPSEIRRGIQYYADMDQDWLISQDAQGAITGAIVRVLKSIGIEDKEELTYARRLIIGYLTLPTNEKLHPRSSKKISDGEWIGFSRWQSERMQNGQYRERPTFASEVIQVLYRARHDLDVANGQLPLFGLLAYWEDIDENEAGVFEIEDFKENARQIYREIKRGEGIKTLVQEQ